MTLPGVTQLVIVGVGTGNPVLPFQGTSVNGAQQGGQQREADDRGLSSQPRRPLLVTFCTVPEAPESRCGQTDLSEDPLGSADFFLLSDL